MIPPSTREVLVLSFVATVFGLLFITDPLSLQLALYTAYDAVESEDPAIASVHNTSTTNDFIANQTAEPGLRNSQVTQDGSVPHTLEISPPAIGTTPEAILDVLESETTPWSPSESNATLNYNDCTGLDTGVGRILEIRCPPFTTGEPIILKKQETYNFTIDFEAGQNSKSLKPLVFGIGVFPGGLKAPFRKVEQNSCKTITPRCPITAGKIYTYSASIQILKSFPTSSFVFQWSLKPSKDSARNQICFRMPVRIVSA